MKIQVKVSGMEELRGEMQATLREVMDELQIGVNATAELAAQVIRSRAPVGPSGNLKEAVKTKPLPRKERYPQVCMVGVDYKMAPHQHLVEFGTGPRYHKSGKSVGQAAPYPFFRSSIDSMQGAIKAGIGEAAARPINRRGG